MHHEKLHLMIDFKIDHQMQVFHGASNGNLCQVCQTIIKLKEAKTSLKNGAFVLIY